LDLLRDEVLRAEICDQALTAARAVTVAERRAKLLGQLINASPEAQRAAVVQEALAAARDVEDSLIRVKVLGKLLVDLSAQLKAEAIREIVAALQKTSDDDRYAEPLLEIAPCIPC
jgi:hypothetical protein